MRQRERDDRDGICPAETRTRRPSTSARREQRDGGFSAVELVIGVAMLAIVAATGVAMFLPTIQRYQTRSGADQIAGDLRKIQGLAMTSGSRHRLFVRDCPSGPSPCKEYRIERGGAGGVWPASSDTPTTNGNVLTEWLDLQREYAGVRVTQLRNSAPTDRDNILFDSRGASVNPGVTYPLTVTVLHTSGTQRTVQVRSAGGVRMQ